MKLVPSFGPKNPRLIVVGESPGQEEAFLGKPFVGDTGRVVRLTLQQAGFDPEQEVYYTNATLCEPKVVNKDKAMPVALQACKGRLSYALNQFPSNVPVLALGKWARKVLGISQDRWETEQLTGKPAIGTIHPVLAMYSDNGNELTYFERVVQKLAKPAMAPQHHSDDLFLYTEPLRNQIPKSVPISTICVDIETSSYKWWDPDGFIAWFGVSFIQGGQVVNHIWDKDFLYGRGHTWLQNVWHDLSSQIGGHNFKYDMLWLAKELGLPIEFGWDTMLMLNILDTAWIKDLKSACGYYFNTPDWSKPLHNWLDMNIKKKADRSFDKVPEEIIVPYLNHDIHFNLMLYYTLRRKLKNVGRWERPYKEFELPLSNELARMEWRGFAVDLDRVEEETEQLQEDMRGIAIRVLEQSAGEIENPNSYKQVGEHIYGTLGLRHSGKGLARTSTAEGALITLDDQEYPIVKSIREYRRVSKMSSSYLKNLPQYVVRNCNGVSVCHPTAKQAHVVTGRLSFADPAIQTIPKKNDMKDAGQGYGQRVKNCYMARPGYVLLVVDGSQWELRVAAGWSGDQWLLDAYNAGVDIHSAACDMMWGPGWDQAQRTKEKNVMFGLIYGGSLEGIIASAGITSGANAKKVYDFFKIELKDLMSWRQEMFELARQQGQIVSPYFNRAFPFHFIHQNNLHNISKYAVNWPIQGTASNITLQAAVEVAPAIRRLGGGLVATIHDSNIPEVPLGKEREAAKLMSEALEEVGSRAFPMLPWKAEAEIGFRWGTMVDYDWRLYE